MEGILVPVKRLSDAKARLSEVVPSFMRRRLGLAMLADVLRVVEPWKVKIVVTDDPDAEAVGLAFGCTLVADGGDGLNGAVVRGTEAAIDLGMSSLLVLASDVPLVSTPELIAIFASVEEVVVGVSTDGGTNALLRRPADAIAPAFGEGSAAAHEEAARSAGLSFLLHKSNGVAFDVDGPADLERLASSSEVRQSVRVARDAVRFQEDGGRAPP